MTIAVLVVEMPHGERGGKNRLSLSKWKHFDYDSASTEKKSTVEIVNDDKLCLARAIVMGKAYIDPSINWDYIRDKRYSDQKNAAVELCRDAGVDLSNAQWFKTGKNCAKVLFVQCQNSKK